MQTERRVAANPQTKPTDLGCESAERLAATIRGHIAIYYYYSARKLILILPSHGRWKADNNETPIPSLKSINLSVVALYSFFIADNVR